MIKKDKNGRYYNTDKKEVSNEIINFWGNGYSVEEYLLFDDYYNAVKQNYFLTSTTQKRLLMRYVIYSVKEELATRSNNSSYAEKWAKMATTMYKELKENNSNNSIDSFSEFFQKVERTQDVVRIMPKYKYRPNDALDFLIWCFINYCRRLEGKAECSYEEVYKFYDEKVAEYIKQYGDTYGIFKEYGNET